MRGAHIQPAEITGNVNGKPSEDISPAPRDRKLPQSKSMHAGIAVWCDCCSCEAEPYWAAIAEEMGMELGSDYEGADSRVLKTK